MHRHDDARVVPERTFDHWHFLFEYTCHRSLQEVSEHFATRYSSVVGSPRYVEKNWTLPR